MNISEIIDFPHSIKNCFQIIEDKNLCEYETVMRTWKERLFSLPWKPFTKYKTISKPNLTIYYLGNNALLMHPIMIQNYCEVLRSIGEHSS